MSDVTVKKSVCQAYYLKKPHTWANFYLDCVDDAKNGTLLIHSDYGNWSYYWGSCGSPFKQFLCGLNKGYLIGKLAPEQIFYETETIVNIKNDIDRAYNEYRDLTDEEYNTCIEEYNEYIIVNNCNDSLELYNMMSENCPTIMKEVYGNDPSCISFHYGPEHAITNFYDVFWVNL